MNRYNLQEGIGEGTFGTVFRATRKDDGNEVVAIKRIKKIFPEWNDAFKDKEFRAIIALSKPCKHLVQIFEVIRETDSTLYFVCEYMPDGDLNDFLTRTKERGEKRVDTSMIQSIMHQVLLGLDHIHLLGYMHRDLKPENILMNGSVVKVADFSLVRRTATLERKMTSYVSTRWYRAPELILCAPEYTTAVDMFALGCIMAELYLMFPLFPGNEEIDQLSKILQVLGPLQNDWPEGVQLSKRFNLEFQPPSTQTTRDRLEIIVKTADSVAISFLLRLLDLNPSRRPSTREAMADEYFGPARSVIHNYFTTGQYEQPTFEPSAEQSPTTTPLKNSFANDLVPTVSISPNARNNISADRAGAYYGCYSNTSVAPSCFDPLDYDPRQEISLSSWQSKKRRAGEYRPSQAFNID